MTAQARPTPPLPTHPLQAPPLRRRLACLLYETLLLVGVYFVTVMVLSVITKATLVLQGVVVAVFAAYFAWFWSKGQTLAMRTWHIRLQDAHGQAVSRPRALVRYVLCWLWVLPPLLAQLLWHVPLRELAVLALGWVAVWALLSRFHPQGQYWHDAWAGTRLVNAPALPASTHGAPRT